MFTPFQKGFLILFFSAHFYYLRKRGKNVNVKTCALAN